MTPAEIAAELTDILRTPTGTMVLRPIQGRCLLEAEEVRGLFTQAAVGTGKSIICALAMTLLGGDRPLILTEASNIPQMNKDFEAYRQHWRLPTLYRLESYHTISTRPGFLEGLQPTMVACDEAHKLKEVRRGRGKKFDRWRYANPDVPVLCLSGSPGTEFKEYAAQLLWALPHLATTHGGRVPVDEEGRPRGPEFRDFCKELEENEIARTRFFGWLRTQPGAVITEETFTDTPLTIRHTILPTPPEMEEHWEQLRCHGEAPDGWLLEGPAEQWGHARFLSNGLYQEHVPRPPTPWREARKAWFKFVAERLEEEPASAQLRGGPWDTPGEVARSVLAGELTCPEYHAWIQIKDTHQPDIVPTWLSRAALDFAILWGREREPLASPESGGSIIFVAQTAFGERLSRETGWPYYGDQAKDAKRRHVSRATAPVIICSVHSCGTGKNLQRYSRHLYTTPHSNDPAAEQNIGRGHRSGQKEPVVEVEYLYGCLEDWAGVAKAETEARDAEESFTAPRKLTLAQHIRCSYPDLETAGLAWQKADGAVVVDVPPT